MTGGGRLAAHPPPGERRPRGPSPPQASPASGPVPFRAPPAALTSRSPIGTFATRHWASKKPVARLRPLSARSPVPLWSGTAGRAAGGCGAGGGRLGREECAAAERQAALLGGGDRDKMAALSKQ